MNDIKFILKDFYYDILKNSLELDALSINDNLLELINKKDDEIILLKPINIEDNELLLSINKKPIRVKIKDKERLKNIFLEYNFRQALYWIERGSKNLLYLKFIPFSSIFSHNLNLKIIFDEYLIHRRKDIKLSEIAEGLENELIFKTNLGDLIIIKRFYNNPDFNFLLLGTKKQLHIRFIDNKWLIVKETNKLFTKNFDELLNLEVHIYKNVNFVEYSSSKETYEVINEKRKSGNTLLDLWHNYSRIELKRAIYLKSKLGALHFKRINILDLTYSESIPTSVYNGIVRIKLINLDKDTISTLIENREELLNYSFELKNNFNDKNDTYMYQIRSINDNLTIDLYDSLDTIPERGILELSLRGNEVMHKRREIALNKLFSAEDYIKRALLFIIEGKTNNLSSKTKNQKPITQKTKRFLKEEFGIDELTENQINAIDIAINTPDIAVIQGPPGTGKTTIVAAICDRLMELAEKSKSQKKSKLILVSSFQNDTLEHIASKIYTYGLPTIKVGRSPQSSITAEEIFINKIKNKIDSWLINNNLNDFKGGTSEKLAQLQLIFQKERNLEFLEKEIDEILMNTEINKENLERWYELKDYIGEYKKILHRKLKELEKLNTSEIKDFKDWAEQIFKFLNLDIELTDDEKKFLEECLNDDYNDNKIKKLNEIKIKYLNIFREKLKNFITEIDEELNNWFQETIKYLRNKELIECKDKKVFIAKVLSEIKNDLDGNPEFIRDAITNYIESIGATNQIAGSIGLADLEFENVILEEAARSNPLELIIPITKAQERIILIGDQKQLPHFLEEDILDELEITISSDNFNTKEKMRESLFNIIFKNLEKIKPTRTITLTEQFRMHPFIGDFISRIYYDNKLKPGFKNQEELRKHNLNINWAKDKVTIFCDINKSQGLEAGDKSKFRVAEAKRIIELLEEIITDSNSKNLNIGIISFYAQQVLEIYKQALNKGFVVENIRGEYEISPGYLKTQDGREKLRIGTVDSFQGKEFDIVILSTVRSNTIERLDKNYKRVFGFLALENRLNVAFSRAQRLLIIVGDGEMFADDFAEKYVKGLYEFYTKLSIDKRYGNRIH